MATATHDEPAAITTPPPSGARTLVPASDASEQHEAAGRETPSTAADGRTGQLFEAMEGLLRLEGAAAGARFCLEAAMTAVPCLAGLAHVVDAARGDLVVVHARGPRADGLVGTHTPQDDALVARAARGGKPAVVTPGAGGGAEAIASERHAFFDPWSVVLVPVVAGGRLIALLELIDPVEAKQADDVMQDALTYVAGCLGRFLTRQTQSA